MKLQIWTNPMFRLIYFANPLPNSKRHENFTHFIHIISLTLFVNQWLANAANDLSHHSPPPLPRWFQALLHGHEQQHGDEQRSRATQQSPSASAQLGDQALARRSDSKKYSIIEKAVDQKRCSPLN